MNKVIISGNLTKDMDVMVSKNDVNIESLQLPLIMDTEKIQIHNSIQ